MQKVAQKRYNNRQDYVGKVTHRELCKRLKFNYVDKQYMHKPDSVLENEIHKILLDFRDTNGSPNSGQKARPCIN